jgi:hypothetical protein
MPSVPSYWHTITIRSIRDSFTIFETNPHLLVLGLLGALVTAALVLAIRGRKAFVEHIIANIGIAFGGAILTWLLVYAWIFIRMPAKTLAESEDNLTKVIEEKRQQSIVINSLKNENESDTQQIAALTQKADDLKKAGPRVVTRPAPEAPLKIRTVEFVVTDKKLVKIEDGREGRIVFIEGLTNKSITPVDVTLNCDREISPINDAPKLGGQRAYMSIGLQPVSDKTFHLTIGSPPWTQDAPLGISVFSFGDQIATCEIRQN